MFEFNREQTVTLHLTWFAFFLTFVAWFNMAPFNTTLIRVAGLSAEQVNILMICNVALTIPARIFIGTLVDVYGPRLVFTALLVFSGVVCFQFALAQTFGEILLSRLLMGIAGAGFVVGIKMIAEWFPPGKMGTAQGIYAGWGNFGAAAAAFSLPPIAGLFSPEIGWRMATGFSGLCCLAWAFIYFKNAVDHPERADRFIVGLEHTIDVTHRRDLVLQICLLIPVYAALGAFIWKLSGHPLFLLTPFMTWVVAGCIVLIYLWNVLQCLRFNLPRLAGPIPPEQQYEFRQIVVLSLVYALTFGSELAVVSMFPGFLENTFGLSVTVAGVLGSSFAFMNLVTRPSGGWLSDLIGRRRTLYILVLGAMVCYWIMSKIDAAWPLEWAVAVAILCSVFLQAGNGACFACVPLIRRDLTGKLAGMAGAYGNVGAVYFLTLLSFVGPQAFFKTISIYAVAVLASLLFLRSFKNLHVSYH